MIKREKRRKPAAITKDYQAATLMGDRDVYDNENFID